MNSNNSEKQVKRKRWKLDKQSSANIVLAFTFICFMLTMFMASNSIGGSYALPTDEIVPTTLNSNITKLEQGKAWSLMNDQYYQTTELSLTYDFKATDTNGQNYEMYCIEGQKMVSNNPVQYTDPQLVSNTYAPGLAYILNNGYGSEGSTSSYLSRCDDNTYTITSNDMQIGMSADEKIKACKKYITQYTIWYYMDMVGAKDSNGDKQLSSDQSSNMLKLLLSGDSGQASEVARTINLFANDAVQYNQDHQGAVSISIDKDSIKYSLTSDGKYLESNEITITGNNLSIINYQIGLANNTYDAVVVDASGNSSSGITSSNNKFRVRIPVEKIKDADSINLQVMFAIKYASNEVYSYTPSDPGVQIPIIAKTVNKTIYKTINVNFTQISKTDISNGKLVAGAQLSIKNSSGAEVAKWTSTDQPYYVSLPAGDYILSEITSPDGYELNKESVPFTVKDDGTITKVVMKNTPTTNVPNTAENIPVYIYIIGGMILVIGVAVIYVTTKPKKNN
mgnify:FL=1